MGPRAAAVIGSGRCVTAAVTAGIGWLGHLPAHPPVVVAFRRRDGRADAAHVRRVVARLLRVEVPVGYVLVRRI
ncbi:hypothetical protein PUR49_11385 [Streptomyces sp. BE147]|uniref:hypothetical protein n=1 Tax=Streptomyces sp. BE147 TaxID=3002524 RepID=UPI002E75D6AD|nr:hypothetical protein [Streptomyces sp. BE147]MEE1737094.1 hypothetical protein [Streptomyces sp. BE147]